MQDASLHLVSHSQTTSEEATVTLVTHSFPRGRRDEIAEKSQCFCNEKHLHFIKRFLKLNNEFSFIYIALFIVSKLYRMNDKTNKR